MGGFGGWAELLPYRVLLMGVGLKQPTCTKLSCLLASKAETGEGGAWILVCDLGPRTRLSTWVTAHPPLSPLCVVAVPPVCFLMTVRKGMVSVGRGGRVKPESKEDIEIIIRTSYMVKISKRKNINNEFCSNKSNTLICIPQFFWFISVYMIFCASVTYLDFYAHHNQQDIVLFFFTQQGSLLKLYPRSSFHLMTTPSLLFINTAVWNVAKAVYCTFGGHTYSLSCLSDSSMSLYIIKNSVFCVPE